jgi:hypothetical protein
LSVSRCCSSRRLSGTPITPAMVAVAVGVLVGPLVLNDLTVGPMSSTVRTLAEATLAVVLFSDSSRVSLSAPWGEASMPARLLGAALPLTIVLGGLLASTLFGAFSLSDALILAPTDAGLNCRVRDMVRDTSTVDASSELRRPSRRGRDGSGKPGERQGAREKPRGRLTEFATKRPTVGRSDRRDGGGGLVRSDAGAGTDAARSGRGQARR